MCACFKDVNGKETSVHAVHSALMKGMGDVVSTLMMFHCHEGIDDLGPMSEDPGDAEDGDHISATADNLDLGLLVCHDAFAYHEYDNFKVFESSDFEFFVFLVDDV